MTNKERFEDARKSFGELFTNKNEYKLLSEYKGAKENIELLHIPCGSKFKIIAGNFKDRMSGCPKCRYKKTRKTMMDRYGVEFPLKSEKFLKKVKDTNIIKYGTSSPFQNKLIRGKIEEKKVIDFFNNKILKLDIVSPLFNIKDYHGVSWKYKWKCLKCGKEFYDNMDNGKMPRCKHCYPTISGVSSIEREIKDWLEKINSLKIESNKRFYYNKSKFYEIDIYIPSQKIGIELNGLYWHSEIGGGKGKRYHLDKTNHFNKLGINILHIFDVEWINKQSIIKSIILYKLGLNGGEKIFARKCVIKEIDVRIKNDFLNANHLQGEDKSRIKMGLFYNKELVSIATLGTPRFNKKYDWELIRFCSKLNTNVVGGFSKLLSYFRNNYQGNIITYADRRFSNGNVYLKNGFNLINESSPNYFYTKNHKDIESREKFQKHKLKNILKKFNPRFTEWENMQINGYDRIWDCGNYVFENNLKSP